MMYQLVDHKKNKRGLKRTGMEVLLQIPIDQQPHQHRFNLIFGQIDLASSDLDNIDESFPFTSSTGSLSCECSFAIALRVSGVEWTSNVSQASDARDGRESYFDEINGLGQGYSTMLFDYCCREDAKSSIRCERNVE